MSHGTREVSLGRAIASKDTTDSPKSGHGIVVARRALMNPPTGLSLPRVISLLCLSLAGVACSSTSPSPSSQAPASQLADAAGGSVDDGGRSTPSDGGADAAPVSSDDEACVRSGGTVESTPCCAATHDFPDTCSPGACTCNPDHLEARKTCRCGTANQCWSQSKRACVGMNTGPSPFDGAQCRSFCGGTGPVACARVVGSDTAAGTGLISSDADGCFVQATVPSYSARFHFDCSKGVVCLVNEDASESCQPAAGGGAFMVYSSGTTQVLCSR